MAQHDIVVTDYDFGDLSVERAVFDAAGLPLRSADSRDAEELARAAEGATVLLVQYAPITAALMDRLDGLELVVRYGVGVDGVDLRAAAERGIAVCNVVDYGTEEVAAHTAALLLAAWRHVPMLDRRIREGGWDYRGPGAIPRLGDSTLGLVGLGRIGSSVARGLRPWFAEVIAADPFVASADWPQGVTRVERDEVFDRAHALSLHLPLTSETTRLVDAERLAALPHGAVLVNTSRGGLIDLDDLVAALDVGRLRAAALDVLPQEPPATDHPIRRHPRALLTPHAGWFSTAAEHALRRMAAERAAAWCRGERPDGLVVEPA